MPPDCDFFHKTREHFGANWSRLFFLDYRGVPVVGGFAFTFGRAVAVWKFGWSGAYRKQHPTYVFWWYMKEWARENGYSFLDRMMVEPRIAALLKAGESVPEDLKKHHFYGPTYYKVGFGGELYHLPGAYCWFRSRMSRILFGTMYPRFRRWKRPLYRGVDLA